MFDLCLSWNVFEPSYNILVEFNRNIESKISDEFVNMKFYDFLCSYASGLWERLNVGEDFPTYQPWKNSSEIVSAGFAKDMEATIVAVLSHLTGYLIIVFILSGLFFLGSERYIS